MTSHDAMPRRDDPAGRDHAHDHRFRLAMAAAPIGLALVDLTGRWDYVNPALQQILGLGADELVGRAVSAFIHPDDVALADAIATTVTGDGAPVGEVRARLVHHDGSVLLADVAVRLVRDAQGAAEFLLLQAGDVTAACAADAQRQASIDLRTQALEASQRQLQLFADAVAHDLRAPLRSIESFSGLLDNRAAGRLDDTDRDYLQRIRSAAKDMSGLLAAFSELSSATRVEMRPARVDLGLLAEWVGAELQEADPGRRAEIVVQPGLLGWGDERLLKQLLGHLMGNAWKFSRDCATTRIEVAGRYDGGMLWLTVSDAGIGFDTRYAHKLFEPFQRLHGPAQGGGHGLGLAIAQRIVDRHGGRISGDSQSAGGATFTVQLRAADVAEERPDA